MVPETDGQGFNIGSQGFKIDPETDGKDNVLFSLRETYGRGNEVALEYTFFFLNKQPVNKQLGLNDQLLSNFKGSVGCADHKKIKIAK